MSAKTDYTESGTLNFWLCPAATAPTRPAAHYIALFTAMGDGEAATVTEVTGGAYAREAVTFTESVNGSSVANTAKLSWAVATANWGTIVGAGVYTALTGGTLLYYKSLDTSKLIVSGDQFVINAGALVVSEA